MFIARQRWALWLTLCLLANLQPSRPPPTPVPVFDDNFETETNWQIFEELVGGNPCYGAGLGSVARSPTLAFEGTHSLRVWANEALSPRSNHVIAYQRLANVGQFGLWRYTLHAYISPATAQTGQTGPEFSLQNTRPTLPNTATTAIAGIQYRASPYTNTGQWHVWHNGAWAVFLTQTLQAGTWYTLTLEANFSTNTYHTFALQGGGLQTQIGLTNFHLAEEHKAFKPSFVITLESENLWNNCGQAGNFEYRVYYDQVSLTQAVTRFFLPLIRR